MPDLLRATLSFPGDTGPVRAYLSRPPQVGPLPAVIVIHEIFGLNSHIQAVADRFASQGYVALAPDLYSRPALAPVLTPANIEEAMNFRASLTPAQQADPAAARQALELLPAERQAVLQKTMACLFGGMPRPSLVRDLVGAVDYLNAQPFVRSGSVGSVGFCFGGGMSIALACQAPLAACVVFYGENPDPIELVEHIPCPILGLYGADDLRINRSLDRLVHAMVEYRKDFEMRIYPGAAHAFFNDTRPQVYRPAPAAEAWERVLRFYNRTLKP